MAGAGGQHERGIQPSAATAASFDEDRSFMAIEVIGHQLHFQAVSRTGEVVDHGVVRRRESRLPSAVPRLVPERVDR